MKKLILIFIFYYPLTALSFLPLIQSQKQSYPQGCDEAPQMFINEDSILPWKETHSFSLDTHAKLNTSSRHVKKVNHKDTRLKAFVYSSNIDDYLVGQDIITPYITVCLFFNIKKEAEILWTFPVMNNKFNTPDEVTVTAGRYIVIGRLYEPKSLKTRILYKPKPTLLEKEELHKDNPDEDLFLDHSFIVGAVSLFNGKPLNFDEALVEFTQFATRDDTLLKNLKLKDN